MHAYNFLFILLFLLAGIKTRGISMREMAIGNGISNISINCSEQILQLLPIRLNE